jgi:hypothetical protein
MLGTNDATSVDADAVSVEIGGGPHVTLIRILHTPGCENAPHAHEIVCEAVKALRLDAAVEMVEVSDDATAQALGLRGSPTITIDGLDLESDPPPINLG